VVHADLLFTDVQGSEAAMIRGGRRSLSHSRYLFMEVEHKEMYRDQALRNELLAMLPEWGMIEDFGGNVLLKNTQFAGAS